MLDVGWSELLVIAVVLIVVVGPKDLPPMLRAFARMSRKFSTMAGEFRKQFDDALNDADMGDLRQTISDVQKLHPVNSIREAMNPLRQAAEDIRSDLKRTVEAPVGTPAAVATPDTSVSPDPATVPVVATAPSSTPVPAAAPVAVTTTEALKAALPVPPVAEVVSAKPAKPRKAKAASAEADAPASKPARKRAAAVTDVSAEAKPKKKAAPKKKDKA